MSMTWNEFKAQVDKQMEEKGLTGDEDLHYIDTSWPDANSVDVMFNGDFVSIA